MQKLTYNIFTISLIGLLSACSHEGATFPSLLADDSQEEFHRNKNKDTTPYVPVSLNNETFIGQKIKFLQQGLAIQTERLADLKKQSNKTAKFSVSAQDIIRSGTNLLQTIQNAEKFKDICPSEQKSLQKLRIDTENLIKETNLLKQAISQKHPQRSVKKLKTSEPLNNIPIKSAQKTTLSTGQEQPIFIIKFDSDHIAYQEALRTIIKSARKQKGKDIKFYILGLSNNNSELRARQHQKEVIAEIRKLGISPVQIFQDYLIQPNLPIIEIRIFAQ